MAKFVLSMQSILDIKENGRPGEDYMELQCKTHG